VTAPLAGIRILEVGVMLAGPYATMLLADLGAEVIKIEPPGGEISRQVSDSYFASINRNKQSVVLDLRSDSGRQRLGELVAKSHALLVNMKPSAIRRHGLTYDALRQFNERIVCVALTGFGLDGGDDPAFDYVVQAATGVAAMTGHPDDPPTLPGYSSADNSTGLAAALGLLAQIVSGRGGQVDVSLRDVMLSQLNYRASAYLNDGAEPLRYPYGAHSYYVPAQLFATADGYLALFITHDAFWRSFATEAGIEGFPMMAERAARREEVLAVVAAALASDSAKGWEARLRPLGIPAAAVRTLPEALEATPEVVVTAGDFRLVGSPIHVDGYEPDYRPAPRIDEHGSIAASPAQSS
jgi:crotonobetainyl-CoA:carnitine CoA-transferase CaiB-like acyl-CoA transferase